MLAFMGHREIVLIVLALLLLFGGRKIPELARGLGSGIREFQQGLKDKGDDGGAQGDRKPELDDRDPNRDS